MLSLSNNGSSETTLTSSCNMTRAMTRNGSPEEQKQAKKPISKDKYNTVYLRPGVKKPKNANYRDMVNYEALKNIQYEMLPNYDNSRGRGNRKYI